MIMFGIGGKGCLGPDEGICVNKQEVEPQLKANKTVYYQFDKNYTTTTKIKRCKTGKTVGRKKKNYYA